MALRILGRPARKPTWEELRARLVTAVGEGAPASEDPSSTWVAWHEGPSIATVQAAVGDTTGWEWAAVAPDLEAGFPPPSSSPTVWARRSYSRRALATGLVRFYASKGRYFTTGDERGREAFARIMDVDHPAVSGYAIVDAMVEHFLDQAVPVGPSGPGSRHVIDELSDELRRLGYEALWAVAYREVG